MFGEPSLKIPQRRIEIVRTPIQVPNANAYAERWGGSGPRECLDRLLIFGRRQFEHVLRVYIRDFNRQRPHRARWVRKSVRQAARAYSWSSPPSRSVSSWRPLIGAACERYVRGTGVEMSAAPTGSAPTTASGLSMSHSRTWSGTP